MNMTEPEQRPSAERIIEQWTTGSMSEGLDPDDKVYVRAIVEGLLPCILEQGTRSTLSALDLEKVICSNLLARGATMKVRRSFTKENFDMATKATELARKMNVAISDVTDVPRQGQTLGIGSRMRPLLKKSEGAFEEAIAETDREPREEADGVN
jgi:hypothetical protein